MKTYTVMLGYRHEGTANEEERESYHPISAPSLLEAVEEVVKGLLASRAIHSREDIVSLHSFEGVPSFPETV